MKAILQYPVFRGLLFSGLANRLGTGCFNLAFLAYAATLPNPKLAVGLASFVNTLPFLFNFILGTQADRTVHHLKRMKQVRVIQVLAYLILALLFVGDNNWVLYSIVILVNLLSDVLGNYSRYLSLPLIKESIPQDKLARARGLQSGSYQAVDLVSGSIGALLLTLLDNRFSYFLLVNAAMFGLSYLCLLRIKVTSRPIQSVSEPLVTHHYLASFRAIQQVPHALAYIGIFLVMNLLSSYQETLMNLTLLDYPSAQRFYNYSLSISFLVMLESVGMILGSFFPLKGIGDRHFPILFCLVFMCFGLSSLAFQHQAHLVLIGGCFALLGYVMGMAEPRFDAMVMSALPENQLGTVLSAFSTLLTLSLPIGAGLGSAMAQLVGSQAAWYVAIILSFIGVIGLSYTTTKEAFS